MSQHPHDSARTHVTGESAYLCDRLPLPNELLVGFVGSPVARGRIRSVDTTAARRREGVVAVFTARDIPGTNGFGPLAHDQPFLASETVSHAGEPIVLVVARTREALHAALAEVRIDIAETTPVLTIAEAIRANSFMGETRVFSLGDVTAGFERATHVIEGAFESGAQEHYYFETQSAISYPAEDGAIEVHSSTQHPTETQHAVAAMLGLPQSRVVCVTKRLGGGFGGKESQAAHFAGLAALVTHHTGRPARLILERDQDMICTGKRHPFQSRYRIGIDASGRILALESELFANGGAWLDLSPAILDRALFHATNAYYVPNVKLVAKICRTNLPSNTAFRGFGAPQGALAMEHMIEEIARVLKTDPLEIRRINLFGKDERNETSYGQRVVEHSLPDLVERLAQTSHYRERREAILATRPGAVLRGISLVPVNFGISFTTTFLNQGNALVNVHLDGSVQVSTGAVEMGQGVNIKIAQCVADVFGIPVEQVRVMPTSTEKNHNTSATAASSGADLNCGAAMEAALRIRERLAHCACAHFVGEKGEISLKSQRQTAGVEFSRGVVFDRTRPDTRISFENLLRIAFMNRVSLGEYAHYRTPDIHFDRVSNKGAPFRYFTQGAAVTEVEIDRFTGMARIVQADILMDLGESFNTAIDRGQILGAFLQGVGWLTNEEVVFSDKGILLSSSTSTYKIPAITDLPERLHCRLWNSHPGPSGAKGSKAVGEPPLLLAISAWTAIRNALETVPGVETSSLCAPATGERILLLLDRHTAAKRAAR